MNLMAAVLTPLMLTLPNKSSPDYPASCAATRATRDIGELRVYRSIGGEPFTLLLTKDVRGHEGMRDTTYVDPGPGAEFYVTVSDTAGNTSCPSTIIAIAPAREDTVSVAVDPVVETRRYDIHGRRVGSGSHAARGVYWEIRRYLSGRTETRKLVVLR